MINQVDYALWGVGELRKMGYRVICVTSNYGEVGDAKFYALERLGFNFPKEDFFEASDKSLIACDYLIDDNPTNVLKSYGEGVLFSQPWNKYEIYTPRMDDWKDVVRFFEKEMDKYEY
jgi:5'(3')-deoxyribonucleotidase